MINFVSSGNFSSTEYWQLSSRVSVSAGTLKMENKGIGGMIYAKQYVPFTAGRTYELSWNAKRSGRYDVWCAYGYRDKNGALQVIDAPSMESKVGTAYSRLTYYISIPADASDINGEIYLKAGANASDGNSILYIQNVTMYDVCVSCDSVMVSLSKYSANVGDTITATASIEDHAAKSYTFYTYEDDDIMSVGTPITANTQKIYAYRNTNFSMGVIVETMEGLFLSGKSDVCYAGGSSGGLAVSVSVAPMTATVGTQVTWTASATGNTGAVSWTYNLYSPSGLYSKGSGNYVSTPVTASSTWYATFTAQDSVSTKSATGGNVNVSNAPGGSSGGGTFTTASGKVVVNSSTLNVRAGAGATAPIIGTLTNGQTVTYIDIQIMNGGTGWYQIISPMSGYVAAQYIQPFSSSGPPPSLPNGVNITGTKGFVDTKTDPLTLRESPSSSSKVVVKIPRHASVYYYTTNVPDFHYVEYKEFNTNKRSKRN